MVYIGLLVILIIIFLDLWKNRNIFSPVFMFSSLFFLITFLALLKLNNIREYSNTALYSIELGVIFFAIGALLTQATFTFLGRHTRKELKLEEELKLNVNWSFLKLLAVILTFGSLITLGASLKLLATGVDYSQVRNVTLGYDGGASLISSPMLRGLVSYVSSPALSVLIPFAIYFLVKREHFYFSFLIFLNVVIMTFATGGRNTLLYTVIQFLAVIYYANIRVSKKMKKLVLKIVFVGGAVMVLISVLRTSNSFFTVFYGYFSGPVVLLSEWQDRVNYNDFWTYGLSFFYPFTYLANGITQKLGVNVEILTNAVAWQGAPQDTWISVFPNMPMNAFVTPFYFFYQDLRFFGVILFSLVFGGICSLIYYKAYYLNQIKFFIIYLLLIKAIVGSFMIWQLGSTTFFVSLVMLWLCLRRSNYGMGG